jgi:hypothetical protein
MKRCLIFLLLFLTFCSRQGNDIKEGSLDVLCQLKENMTLIGQVESFSMGEPYSVVSTGEQIIIFDAEGNQRSVIDKQGRGPYEYVDASTVRHRDDRIYAWDSSTLKFIVFDMDGEGILECRYDSAISDFVPDGDKVYIYTLGRRVGHIIDVLDLVTGEIVESLLPHSFEHEVLLMQASMAPLTLVEGKLYFMPKDSLVLYRYAVSNKHLERIHEFDSPSFSVKPFEGSIEDDYFKTAAYTFENSYTVGLAVKNDKCNILTMEGTATINTYDTHFDDNSLFSSLYSFDITKTGYLHVKYSDFINTTWVSSFDGSLYVLDHEVIDDGDRYSICKLSQ